MNITLDLKIELPARPTNTEGAPLPSPLPPSSPLVFFSLTSVLGLDLRGDCESLGHPRRLL